MCEHPEMHELAGVFPALITPLNSRLEVDVPVLERLLACVYQSGVDGVYVCGSTGEGKSLPVRSRRLITDTAIRCSPPGKKVIAHVGADSAEDAIVLAKHAEDAGAHAISSLPPDSDSGAIQSYYVRLASAVRIPLLLYYCPEIAPGLSSLGDIRQLCAVPNVVGLKFTDFNLYWLSILSRAGLTIFNGRDEVFAAGLLMGAAGGIGSFYNVVPAWFVNLFRAARNSDFEEARRWQQRINGLIEIVLQLPMLPALKQILEWEGMACGPSIRSRSLTAEEVANLRLSLEKLDLRGAR